jgi:hypothetical protein
MFVILVLIVMIKHIREIYTTVKLLLHNQSSVYLIIFVFLYVFNISCVLYQIASIKDKSLATNISFTYESKNYKSNDSLLFIGATSKYIFIRNTKNKTNLIFDKASIKNLSLTE